MSTMIKELTPAQKEAAIMKKQQEEEAAAALQKRLEEDAPGMAYLLIQILTYLLLS